MKPNKQELLELIDNLTQDVLALNLRENTREEIIEHCLASDSWFSIIKAKRIMREYGIYPKQ